MPSSDTSAARSSKSPAATASAAAPASNATGAEHTLLERLGRTAAVLTVLSAIGCGVYLVAAGTQPGAPFVFVVGSAVALCVTLYLLARTAVAVLVEPQADEERVATGRRKKELEREKQTLLKALKELSFDHDMHKISTEDYEKISAGYRARAVRVMRQLDEGAHAYRKQIEEELARRRGGAPAAAPATATATATRSAAASDRHECVHCGAGNERDAVFCKKCGQRIDAEVSA